MQNQPFPIEKCRELIERKLGWGNSDSWQNQDFEVLSEKIFEETKVSLSVSTLKRVWGKVRYESTPNLATLNVLAKYAGFENWRDFTASHFSKVENAVTEPEEIPEKRKKNLPAKNALIFIIPLVLLAFVAFLFAPKPLKKLHFEHIQFKSKPVTLGLPNSVIFQYDAQQSNADSVFIQQSWDHSLRVKVDKDKHEFASTYYYPGFYKAKLVLNDSVVKEHNLYIETDGWLGIAHSPKVPVYFSANQITKKEGIGISENDLASQKIDLHANTPMVSLYNVSKKIKVSSDNFRFQTQVKSTFNHGEAVCQFVSITLLCENGMHSIPLSIKGCIGKIGLILGNEGHPGKTNNLSGFGVDFSDWVSVLCEVKEKHVRIFVNKTLSFEGDFKHEIGPVIGLQYSFMGTGIMKDYTLEPL